mgnify:CR=1 FL=1
MKNGINPEDRKYYLQNGISAKQLKVVEAFRLSATNIKNTCQIARIHRSTFYHWLQTSKIFAEAINNEREAIIDYVESKLFQAVTNGNFKAIKYYLNSKAKERGYVKENKVLKQEVNPISNLSMQELDELLSELEQSSKK